MTGIPHGTAAVLREVIRAVGSGSGSVGDVARRCGLAVADTQAALAVLESVGRVRHVPLLDLTCAPQGCGSCASAPGCPVAGAPGQATSLTTWHVVAHD